LASRNPDEPRTVARVDLYNTNYRNFAEKIYADIRRETYGEDMGQQSWTTSVEQDQFISWLRPRLGSRLLDVCCGAGGPALRMAQLTGCTMTGIDNNQDGIAAALAVAEKKHLSNRVQFKEFDANQTLPFEPNSFESLLCIDSINHLPDRKRVLSDWARVVKPGGKILFTDPITVTGMLSNEEIATRSAIGFFIFTPKGDDERLLNEAALKILNVEDVTENVVTCAGRRYHARETREDALRKIEGKETYEGQQDFLRVTELLARERRLSRFAYLAEKPS
jgi:ubiquinone/menaquinone biosynthesis C-methylase UbiE